MSISYCGLKCGSSPKENTAKPCNQKWSTIQQWHKEQFNNNHCFVLSEVAMFGAYSHLKLSIELTMINWTHFPGFSLRAMAIFVGLAHKRGQPEKEYLFKHWSSLQLCSMSSYKSFWSFILLEPFIAQAKNNRLSSLQVWRDNFVSHLSEKGSLCVNSEVDTHLVLRD